MMSTKKDFIGRAMAMRPAPSIRRGHVWSG
jgi:hypothetical protein